MTILLAGIQEDYRLQAGVSFTCLISLSALSLDQLYNLQHQSKMKMWDL